MLIGIATLLMSLFGGGSMDVFYIDKIDQGVKKEIVDKDRKKELEANLKDYTKTVKAFNKTRKNQIKELKKKNLDRSTTKEWYVDFYKTRLQERIDFQKQFIKKRLLLQEMITDTEWDAIMNKASDQTTKLAEKEQRKEMKKKGENAFRVQEKAIVENVVDQESRMILLDALSLFETRYNQIHDSYENINVNESVFLADKNATEQEMLILAGLLNEQRISMYEGYTVFLMAMHNNTSDEEWRPIMKAVNKLLE